MSLNQMSTAVRGSICHTATPIERLRVDGVAVHVRGALVDEDVLTHVDHVLRWNFDRPVAVHATICCGAITLHGVVDWGYQRLMAERVVRKVFGVRSVTNQIASRRPDS